jgi:uncharacterized membrane protein YraQ (UPF0718 family)
MFNIILLAIQSGLQKIIEIFPEFIFGSLLPALLLSGALNTFTSRKYIRYLFGGGIKKVWGYLLATFIGIIFSGCACGVLPLFVALLEAGSTFGIAISFLFAGPTLNILAIVLTGQLFSWHLSIFRIVFTVIGAIFIGVIMELLFKKNISAKNSLTTQEEIQILKVPLKNLIILLILLLILLLLESYNDFTIWQKGYIWIGWLVISLPFIFSRFSKEEVKQWITKTLHFSKKIIIPITIGLFTIGVLEKLLSSSTPTILSKFQDYFGTETFFANFISAFLAALMYFGTCVSVIIVKFFQNSGMTSGPMMSLFLAGPAISFPAILAMQKIMGWMRTFVYLLLVVLVGSLSGYIYGNHFVVNKFIVTEKGKSYLVSYQPSTNTTPEFIKSNTLTFYSLKDVKKYIQIKSQKLPNVKSVYLIKKKP